jgi:hypothetical protein
LAYGNFHARQIGFVFSTPQQCWGLTEIGFDWLCFFAALKDEIPHNLLPYKHLRHYSPSQNWLCFFKNTTNHEEISNIQLKS